eukprot:CAMPEP_0179417142 /NCGR_PEP_ID=MMETSP0799-20121207/7199_1 /TAXON_ID=46947 /ORGANISM="Geminigera cryophila, Strain CCMP2564" /LENGTH=67 /DNA_ID=CAMNT_0021190111 /DNA_START=357 /DNA_END=560 /DNA_ORIENTATION=-
MNQYTRCANPLNKFVLVAAVVLPVLPVLPALPVCQVWQVLQVLQVLPQSDAACMTPRVEIPQTVGST